MNPLDRIAEILIAAEALLQDIKDHADDLSLRESHRLYSSIREVEAWMQSARNALEPESGSTVIR